MRKYLFLAATVATLSTVGTAAFSQMAGQVGGGVGGSPQDARQTDYAYDELKAKEEKERAARSNVSDELVIGADLVKQQKYAEAIPHLELALAKKPNNATTLIYLGFSHRMVGAGLSGDARNVEFQKALGYYRQAATIDPDNQLLHEYLGKLFILMKDQASAQNELKTLDRLCPSGCESRDALSKVLLAYIASTTPIGAPAPVPTTK